MQQLGAVRGVHHFGVEHQAVEAAGIVGEGGEGGAFGGADRAEAGRQGDDAVAVAHPHLVPAAFWPDAFEQGAIVFHIHEGAAEFAVVGAGDLAAELFAQGHLAVADAEHRHPGGEHALRGARGIAVWHAGRAAGQDDGFWRVGGDAFRGGVIGEDFAIDPAFAHAAGDELGHLAAEIENQNAVCGIGHGGTS